MRGLDRLAQPPSREAPPVERDTPDPWAERFNHIDTLGRRATDELYGDFEDDCPWFRIVNDLALRPRGTLTVEEMAACRTLFDEYAWYLDAFRAFAQQCREDRAMARDLAPWPEGRPTLAIAKGVHFLAAAGVFDLNHEDGTAGVDMLCDALSVVGFLRGIPSHLPELTGDSALGDLVACCNDAQVANILDREQVVVLLTSLESVLNRDTLGDVIALQAARLEELFQELERGEAFKAGGQLAGCEILYPGVWRVYCWSLRAGALNPLRNLDEDRGTRALLDLSEAVRGPLHEIVAADGSLPAFEDVAPGICAVSNVEVWASRLSVTYAARVVARNRLLQLSILAGQYRQAKGAWPESLNDLSETAEQLDVADFSTRCIDPFGGASIVYELTETGCTFRSAYTEREIAASLSI